MEGSEIMKITENSANEQYDDMLNEMYPLEGCSCNSFATLLLAGDSIAYWCGFSDWCDSVDYEIED
jgi:hypothetical protein